jgi:hypothetical protein
VNIRAARERDQATTPNDGSFLKTNDSEGCIILCLLIKQERRSGERRPRRKQTSSSWTRSSYHIDQDATPTCPLPVDATAFVCVLAQNARSGTRPRMQLPIATAVQATGDDEARWPEGIHAGFRQVRPLLTNFVANKRSCPRAQDARQAEPTLSGLLSRAPRDDRDTRDSYF